MPDAPHTLTYDTLPPQSRLRREVVDGVLKITAAAHEPGEGARRDALAPAAVGAAIVVAVVLVVVGGLFGVVYLGNRQTMSTELSVVLAIAFAVFCAATFAMICWTDFCERMRLFHDALSQSTVIAMADKRLLIETGGHFGNASFDLDVSQIRMLRPGVAPESHKLRCLSIELYDGARIAILRGYPDVELRWVMRELEIATGRTLQK